MKTLFCFVRHGQTNGNKMRIFQGRTDIELNETGKNQAHETANLLKHVPIKWDFLGSSPLVRARETASIINRDLNLDLKVVILGNAIERSFGEAEGIAINEDNYQRILNNEFTGEESEDEIIERAKLLMKELLLKYQGKNLLIVSHSHFIKAVFRPYIKDLKFNDSIRNTSLNFICFDDEVVETSINNLTDSEINNFIKKMNS